MVMKPIAEIYPDWGSQDNESALHQLICDILDGTFDDRFWDVRKAQVSVQSKGHKAKRVDVVEPPKKKHKGKKGSSDGDFGQEVGNKSNLEAVVGLRKDSEEVGLIVSLYDKFQAMETSINSLVGGIEDRMVAKFRENFEQFKSAIENRVSLLETEIKELKTRKPYQSSPEEYTSLKQNQRVSSVKHDDIDSDFVLQELVADKVNKKKKTQEKKNKTDVNKEGKKVDAVQKIVIKSRDDCNKGFLIPHLIDTTSDIQDDDHQPQPQPQEAEGSEVVDITDKVRDEDNKLLSDEEDTEEEKIRNAKLAATFNVLSSAITKLDAVGVPSKISYPPPPPYPAIGNSGLTRMRKDLVPSKAIYDPLQPVDPLRMEALTTYLRSYEHFPLDTKPPGVPSEVYFYRVLITPRAAWPDSTYGWLGDDHITAFMRLLRIRSTLPPIPFHTDRIAFVDNWSVSLWVQDFEQFKINPKKFKFSDGWIKLANGLAPEDTPTFRRWYYDVDNLYLIHNVGGDHWVTLDIDLKKEKIDIYDSIMGEATTESDKRLLDMCRPFTRMTPYLLNEIVPSDVRKSSVKQFTCRRVKKNVPQNKNPGDCGVYSLKFVECLALGVAFDGLSDENIQQLREKMAADILAEAPDYLNQFID